MGTTQWKFAVTLSHGGVASGGLQPARNGTLAIDTSNPSSVTGSLTIPNYFPASLDLGGPPPQLQSGNGTAVQLSGSLPTFEVMLLASFVSDGFAYDATYVGGTINIYDREAEETMVYALQGWTDQISR